MKKEIKKETVERKFRSIKKLLKDLDASYYTENGLAFKSGMIHMYNMFVYEFFGKEGEKLKI